MIFIHSAVGGIIKSLLALFIHPDLAIRGNVTMLLVTFMVPLPPTVSSPLPLTFFLDR